MSPVLSVVYMILSYLFGCVSMADIIAGKMGKDIYKEGSGNPGTTNAFRVLGLKAGLITLIFDFFKGFLPAFILLNVFDADYFFAMWAGFASILGHDFPVTRKFRGGKGAATSFGVLCAVDFKLWLVALGALAIMLITTRIMSISAIITSSFVGIVYIYKAFANRESRFIILTFIVALLIFRHRANIQRLIAGEEKPMSIGGRK